MKILHCADIHLGSKIESKFPGDKSNVRKSEVLNTFKKMVQYASENNINVIILAGDVFDKDNPAKKDKDAFYALIKRNPQIDFLYLNGNHDTEGSYVENDIANLKTFNKEDFTSYEYGNIVISGIELNESNAKSFYSKLSLNKDKINIVVLHGDACDSTGKDKIKIDSLKNKNIDYLALGHIHSYKIGKIDDRGYYAFPGCLEGRGFDECGEKGFIVLDITDKVEHQFIPFACRTIHEIVVDATGANNLIDIEERIKDELKDIRNEDIVRIILTGELELGVEINKEDVVASNNRFFFVDYKDKTTRKINIADYENDKSLIGEFIRGVSNNNEYTEEEKNKIITLGLRLINGLEVE